MVFAWFHDIISGLHTLNTIISFYWNFSRSLPLFAGVLILIHLITSWYLILINNEIFKNIDLDFPIMNLT